MSDGEMEIIHGCPMTQAEIDRLVQDVATEMQRRSMVDRVIRRWLAERLHRLAAWVNCA